MEEIIMENITTENDIPTEECTKDELADSPSAPDEENAQKEESETEKLLGEIRELREKIARLESEKAMQEKAIRQISEFSELFPESKIESIPESVWDTVRSGTSLAAAYALYDRQIKAEAERKEKINSKNAASSPGKAGVNTASEYFSPDEVRKMSAAEIHANYSKIKESMKKWL